MHKVTSRSTLQPEKLVDVDAKNGSFKLSMNGGGGDKDYDYRKSSSAPTRCRFGSTSIHLRTREGLLFVVVFFVVLMLTYHILTIGKPNEPSKRLLNMQPLSYDSVYPLTRPITVKNGRKFRIGLVTDLDHASKVEKSLWQSYLLKGYFYVYDNKTFHLELDPTSTTLHSSLSQGLKIATPSLPLILFLGHFKVQSTIECFLFPLSKLYFALRKIHSFAADHDLNIYVCVFYTFVL